MENCHIAQLVYMHPLFHSEIDFYFVFIYMLFNVKCTLKSKFSKDCLDGNGSNLTLYLSVLINLY